MQEIRYGAEDPWDAKSGKSSSQQRMSFQKLAQVSQNLKANGGELLDLQKNNPPASLQSSKAKPPFHPAAEKEDPSEEEKASFLLPGLPAGKVFCPRNPFPKDKFPALLSSHSWFKADKARVKDALRSAIEQKVVEKRFLENWNNISTASERVPFRKEIEAGNEALARCGIQILLQYAKFVSQYAAKRPASDGVFAGLMAKITPSSVLSAPVSEEEILALISVVAQVRAEAIKFFASKAEGSAMAAFIGLCEDFARQRLVLVDLKTKAFEKALPEKAGALAFEKEKVYKGIAQVAKLQKWHYMNRFIKLVDIPAEFKLNLLTAKKKFRESGISEEEIEQFESYLKSMINRSIKIHTGTDEKERRRWGYYRAAQGVHKTYKVHNGAADDCKAFKESMIWLSDQEAKVRSPKNGVAKIDPELELQNKFVKGENAHVALFPGIFSWNKKEMVAEFEKYFPKLDAPKDKHAFQDIVLDDGKGNFTFEIKNGEEKQSYTSFESFLDGLAEKFPPAGDQYRYLFMAAYVLNHKAMYEASAVTFNPKYCNNELDWETERFCSSDTNTRPQFGKKNKYIPEHEVYKQKIGDGMLSVLDDQADPSRHAILSHMQGYYSMVKQHIKLQGERLVKYRSTLSALECFRLYAFRGLQQSLEYVQEIHAKSGEK